MLKELKVHHRNIVQMAFNGYKPNEIAERLEITYGTVTSVLRSPMGKAYMNGLTDKLKETTIDVRKELVSMNKDALETFKRILTPTTKAPASVQATVAKDILDRTGYKASDKIDLNIGFENKSDEEIDAEIAAMERSIKNTQFSKSCDDNNQVGGKQDGGVAHGGSPEDSSVSDDLTFPPEELGLSDSEEPLDCVDETIEESFECVEEPLELDPDFNPFKTPPDV